MKETRKTEWNLFGKRFLARTEIREFGVDKTASTAKGRKFSKAPTLLPEYEGAFSSVQAAITTALQIEGTGGDYPHRYGDMGDSDIPINNLNSLSEKYSDEELVNLYIKRSGNEEAKNDPDYRRQVVMAIGSIRGATPLRKG